MAYVPNEDLSLIRGNDHPVYAPPLISEILSPSNRAGKLQRQRIAAFSGGTREFWTVDLLKRRIEVTVPGQPSRIYSADETIPVTVLPGTKFPASELFQG